MNDDHDSGDVCSVPDYNSDCPRAMEEWNTSAPSGSRDFNDGKVSGRRDLVDFTPMWIDVSEVFPQGTPSEIKKKLRWRLQSAPIHPEEIQYCFPAELWSDSISFWIRKR